MRHFDVSAAVRLSIGMVTAAVMPTFAYGQLFVADPATNTIGEFTLSGQPINTALISGSGLAFPQGIAISGSDLFVANNFGGTPGNYTLDNASVSEYTTSGAVINPSLISGLNGGPFAIAVSGSDIFITNIQAGTIGEYTTSGATVNAALITGLNHPTGIVVSGSNLFVEDWVTPYSNTEGYVGEYTTGGAAMNPTLITGLSSPDGLAIAGDDLFVTNGNLGTVSEYTTSGSLVNASLLSDLSDPQGIVVSGSDLYVTDYGADSNVGEYTTSGQTVNSDLIDYGAYDSVYGVAVASVPEPASIGLIAVTALGLLARRRGRSLTHVTKS